MLHTPRKYRVHPPKDPAQWAEICCASIRHYNEGWADGFHHDIRYWEIWNEPENQPAMWTGTDDEYLQLYEVTARSIKSHWPNLMVGGPSLGCTGEFKKADIALGADPRLMAVHQPTLLGGVTVIRGVAASGEPIQAVPFFAMASRGNSTQEVWVEQGNLAVTGEWWLGALYRPMREKQLSEPRLPEASHQE